jgi:hypothetical protein
MAIHRILLLIRKHEVCARLPGIADSIPSETIEKNGHLFQTSILPTHNFVQIEMAGGGSLRKIIKLSEIMNPDAIVRTLVVAISGAPSEE